MSRVNLYRLVAILVFVLFGAMMTHQQDDTNQKVKFQSLFPTVLFNVREIDDTAVQELVIDRNEINSEDEK